MNNFDLKKFLIENKLTHNSKSQSVNEDLGTIANIILEQEDNYIFPEMDDLGVRMAKAVEDELEKEKENIDKADGLVGIVGLLLLSDTVASMIKKMAKYLAKKFGSEKALKSAEWWEHFTHENEMAFKSPIKRVVGFYIKDEKQKAAITKVLYAILIFLMAGYSGLDAMEYLKKTNWAQEAKHTAKLFIKGVEVNTLLRNVEVNILLRNAVQDLIA